MRGEDKKHALNCLNQVPPDIDDLIAVLQICRKDGNEADAKSLHAHLCNSGLDGQVVLGNHLVRTFIESGKFSEAQQVFERLVGRDDDSWTSFMHACIDHGNAQYALDLYKQLKENAAYPISCLLHTLLKACGKIQNASRGQALHIEAVKFGLDLDPFVGSALVDMYAKSGSITTAREVFDKLCNRDVVIWTAIIAGCVEHGLVNEALVLTERMQLEGVSANAITFVCILKGCCSRTDVSRAQHVHLDIVKQGFEKDFCVGSALLDIYAKCGSFVEAQKIFEELPVRDVIPWTALITAYAEFGYADEAWDCLTKMEKEGTNPNAVTYICSLKAFGSITNIGEIHQIHAQLVKKGLENYPSVGGTLVMTYGRCGLLEDVQRVFDKSPSQDVFSWNSLLSAYAEQGHDHDALDVAEKMQMEGIPLDAFTYACSVKTCCSQKLIEKGLLLHSDIAVEGYESDSHIGGCLIDMYAKCSMFSEALEVIEELPIQTTVTWTALIAGYIENGLCKEALSALRKMQVDDVPLDAVTFVCGLKACSGIGALESGYQLHAEAAKEGYEEDASVGNTLVDMYVKCGSLKEAEDIFYELPAQQIVSWTALMAGYMELKFTEKALCLYKEMLVKELTLDAVVLVSGLKACGSLGALDIGQKIHADIAKEGFEGDPSIGSTLVDMYAKCGLVQEAWEVFEDKIAQSLVLWTALISGFSCQGDSESVFCVLKMMEENDTQPDAVTLLNVMTVCSHTGLVETGVKFYEVVDEVYGLVQTIELYNALMDLLGRAGQLSEAVITAKNMPYQPRLVTWNTILGACQKWSNVGLGEIAFSCALTLDTKQSAPYVSMISIYADAHMWVDVKRIDQMREIACSHECWER